MTTTDLARLFKSGLDGTLPGLDPDRLDEDGGLTELEKFAPERMDGVATPATGIPILMLKSLGTGPAGGTPADRPDAAVLRKAYDVAIRKALKDVVAEQVAAIRAGLADTEQRIIELEQSRPVRLATGAEARISKAVQVQGGNDAVAHCEECGEPSTIPGARFCTECGSRLGDAAKSDTGAPPKCGNCGRPGSHPESTFCTHCGHKYQRGTAAKSAPGLEALTGAEKVHLAALVKRCEDPATRVGAFGELMKELGPHVAAKVIASEPLSSAEFTRAYLTNGRAGLAAAAGQHPRVPDASHAISPDDFRRDPLATGQERLSPLQTLQQAGQMGFYRPGAGVAGHDSQSGLGNTSTGPSVAVPASSRLSRR